MRQAASRAVALLLSGCLLSAAALAWGACSESPAAAPEQPSPVPTSPESDQPAAEDDSPATPTAMAEEEEAGEAEPSPRPDLVELVEGPLSADGLQVILGTPDVAVGTHRMAFVLNSRESPVTAPFATVSLRRADAGGETGEPETALAVFRPWPYGTRGSYTTSLTFDAAGTWQIDVTVSGEAGNRSAHVSFEVAGETEAPDVGAAAIPSENKTLSDVDDISELTTGSIHDPDLYHLTIAEALTTGMPTVVVMASPAFCINAVCGPQVEVLAQLKDMYEGRVNFIHVDLYDNPQEIQGDLDRARISPTVLEWRLTGVEWSFIIDSEGNIAARFESFATFQELDEALRRLL